MAQIDFAWELGGGTGHVTTLLPIARALKSRGHRVRLLVKETASGGDFAGAEDIPREAAPFWSGPPRFPAPLNFGQILHNFGYADPSALEALIGAWRERLARSDAVVANVSPAAHLAALTLGIPSFEASQGFHVPPPAMPSPPLHDWQPASRADLESADRRVLAAMNRVLAKHGAEPLPTLGDLFAGRAMLLTYPELDVYTERGPAEYFGIPATGEGRLVPSWPRGRGPRVFAYLYSYYPGLAPLLDALVDLDAPSLVLCRGADPALAERHAGGPVAIQSEPMSVSRLLPECDLVVCHGSHQMTAQALLAGKPALMLPTQLEQFLIMRRVVRAGAGLGIAPEIRDADFRSAIERLTREGPRAAAAAFARRYAGHDRGAAMAALVARCEAAVASRTP